ncbi:MAG: hypothetical protein A2169_02420 [Deltaproteobacteria bacterium RBG_13_47_9]|nr:MAG: hypothetical protein A2169_02420 [Deltaproteobacteria bacterium RBG_13_47_9]
MIVSNCLFERLYLLKEKPKIPLVQPTQNWEDHIPIRSTGTRLPFINGLPNRTFPSIVILGTISIAIDPLMKFYQIIEF